MKGLDSQLGLFYLPLGRQLFFLQLWFEHLVVRDVVNDVQIKLLVTWIDWVNA